jgi:hypothetical protein
VEVLAAPGTEVGLSEQVGARVAAGATLHVKFTVALKPFVGAMLMVEVEEAPAETAGGVNADAASVKSTGCAAVTVTVTGAV